MVSATVSECAVPTTAIRLMDGITLFPRRQRPAFGGMSHRALSICFSRQGRALFCRSINSGCQSSSGKVRQADHRQRHVSGELLKCPFFGCTPGASREAQSPSRATRALMKARAPDAARDDSIGFTKRREMREQEGKFILFDVAEFATFLNSLPTSRKILLVQNHHTFIPSYSDFNGRNHFARLAAMEAAHLQRGFDEIAQNLTIFPDGTVAVCRPLDTAPAGIKGANINGLCIENLGNFDAGHDAMTGP